MRNKCTITKALSLTIRVHSDKNDLLKVKRLFKSSKFFNSLLFCRFLLRKIGSSSECSVLLIEFKIISVNSSNRSTATIRSQPGHPGNIS